MTRWITGALFSGSWLEVINIISQLTTGPSNISYRPDIQGLRAIAVALVVLAHAHVPGFAGGFIGVDVFFVLSGYLITGLLLNERVSTGKIRYGKFLARRLKRLLPALLVMLLIVLGAAAFLLSAYEARMQSGSFAFAATWTSNFFFTFVDRDYFAALQAGDLFLHTWSLGIEEQFYVIWPWLVSCIFLGLTREPVVDRGRNVLLIVLAVVFVASLMLSLYWSNTQPLLSFYMMPSRGWQFALGAAVFVWFRDSDRSAAMPLALLVGIAGVLIILGSAVVLTANVTYPGYLALFPSIGTAMVIAAGANIHVIGANRVLASPYFVWLGDRSYSLYLWHWPVLVIGGSYDLTSSVIGVVSLVGLSIVMSMLSYRFIELPFWKGQFSRAEPLRIVLVSVMAMLAVIAFSESLSRNVYGLSATTTTANDYNPRFDVPVIYQTGVGCDTWFHSAEVVPCIVGNENAKSTAVLVGDSIGAQWFSLFPAIFATPDWRFILLTKSSCAIVDVDYFYNRIGANYDVCTEWRNSVLEYLNEVNPDVVFVASSSTYKFSDAQWVDGTSRVLSRLNAATEKIFVIPGTPSLSFDGPGCLDQPYRFSSRLTDSIRECEETQFSLISFDVAAHLQRAVNGSSNAQLLDLNDLVCPDGRCAAQTEDGRTVFRDNQHLTDSFVTTQIPVVHSRLVAMGLEGVTRQTSAETVPTGEK